MSGVPPHGGRANPAAASPKTLDPFQLHIAKRFPFLRLPDALWSARHGLDNARLAELKARCKEKGIRPRTYKNDVVQALLDSPGEREYVWQALNLPLEKLKSLCSRKYPCLLPDTPGAITREELIRRLAENERQALQDVKDLTELVGRSDGALTPEDADLIYRLMHKARQNDILGGTLSGQNAHHHMNALEVKLPECRDMRRESIRAAEDERVQEGELERWPVPRLGRLSERLCQKLLVYSHLLGDDHRLTQAWDDRVERVYRVLHGKVYTGPGKNKYPLFFAQEEETEQEGERDAKRPRVEGAPEKAAAPDAQGPSNEGAPGPATPPAQPGEKGGSRPSPDEPARSFPLPTPVEGERATTATGKARLQAAGPLSASKAPSQPSERPGAAQPEGTSSAAGTSQAAASADEPAPAVLIACYNYKLGGVGSTTTAINLGYTLVEEYGCRTCYVDCDPQCSLTTFFNPPTAFAVDKLPGLDKGSAQGPARLGHGSGEAAGGRVDPCPRLDIFQTVPERLGPWRQVLGAEPLVDSKGKAYKVTLKTVLESAFMGKPTPVDILHFKTKLDEEGQSEYTGFKDGLFLLPGDKELRSVMAEYKVRSAKSRMSSDNAEGVWREFAQFMIGGFRKALHDIARAHNVKYMICDFGPGDFQERDKTLLGSCDYILSTFQPDHRSTSAVGDLLRKVLPSLISNQAEMKGLEARSLPDACNAYRFNPSPPRLLPFLMTGFQLDVSKRKPVVHAVHARELHWPANSLEMADKTVRALFLPDGSGKMVIPFLPHLPNLLWVAQGLGHPAVGLDAEPLTGHGSNILTRPGLAKQFEYMKAAFSQLAKLVRHHCT
eukprot:jgi/Mesvir1/9567/Mv12747-RA.1